MARRPDASLLGEVSLDTRKFDQGVKSVQSSMRGLADGLKAVGAAFAAWGAKELAQTGYEMAKLGAQSLRLKESFEQLADAYQGNSQAILDTLKQASQGAISETNLILGANRAMMLGLGANAEQLGKLMEVAAFRARAMGISTTQAWDNIVTGIGRKSPLILDNLGIVGLKMDETSTKTDIMAQVIVEGQKQIAAAGGMAEDAAAKFERLGAQAADAKEKLAEAWVKSGIPELAVNFVSQGAEGWVNTFDALAQINAWAAEHHTSTLEILIKQSPLSGIFTGPSEEDQEALDEETRRAIEQNDLYIKQLNEQAAITIAQTFQSTELEKQTALTEGLLNQFSSLVQINDTALAQLKQMTAETLAAGVSVENWNEAWKDAPASVEEVASNLAILQQRFAEGQMGPVQFVQDYMYVLSQYEAMLAESQKTADMAASRWQGLGEQMQATAKAAEQAAAAAATAAEAAIAADEAYRAKIAELAAKPQEFGGRPGIVTPQQRIAEALDVASELAKAFNDSMSEANKSVADDFNLKLQGANTIIAGDIAEKVNRALGVNEPLRGGPLSDIVAPGGEAPAEWWRRLPDIKGQGEDSPWADQMRGDIAAVADYVVGPGAGEKVMADEGAMRAAADAILRFGDQFGTAGAAGAIELNTGVVTIDWGAAATGMERQNVLEQNVEEGQQYAYEKMGIPAGAPGAGAPADVPAGVPGAAAAPGAEGGIAGSGYAVMAQDAQVLAEILQTTLMPQLTVVNDFFVTQLNLNIGVANTLLGTDIPNSITTATGSFTSFVSDALEPTTSAAAALNEQLQGLIDKLERLAELDLGDFQPGSPTPFELGLRGINDELDRMGGAWGTITPLSGVNGGLAGGGPVNIHLHVGAMLGREADAYRLANELLPYLNRARRTQRWD